ncbi:transposase [Bradyrhizobium sp. CCBAU 21362]|uniref:transposase n=1 Tax=Bradyrhizobium sp. CCBAU 21362 TaxID=1325082 RepID=UPI003FA4C4CE
MILKRGTMLDATLIQAVSAPPKEDRPSNDPDARFAKRLGKSGATFGYKAHVGVDEGSGLIRAVLTTPANVNDTTPAVALIRGDEAAVWAMRLTGIPASEADVRRLWYARASNSALHRAEAKGCISL